MLVSLQDPQVRADVLARRARGERSNLATLLAESNRQLPPPLPGQPPEGPSGSLEGRGIRDASAPPPSAPEEPGEQQHASSRRFSHGLYNSIEAVEARLRRENPEMSAEEALRQASDRVRSDFVRSLEFMPEGNRATQADLVRAMIRANQVDGRGELAEIYRRNFEAANIPLGESGREAVEARMQAAMASPGTRASEELLQAMPGVRAATGPQVGGVMAADDWLARNAEALGVEGQGLQSQQVYRNDRQETWVVFSDQPAEGNGNPRNLLRVGFDRTGRMIHADPRAWQEELVRSRPPKD